jgi:hypothetical protein
MFSVREHDLAKYAPAPPGFATRDATCVGSDYDGVWRSGPPISSWRTVGMSISAAEPATERSRRRTTNVDGTVVGIRDVIPATRIDLHHPAAFDVGDVYIPQRVEGNGHARA